jgi:hypothetical protein
VYLTELGLSEHRIGLLLTMMVIGDSLLSLWITITKPLTTNAKTQLILPITIGGEVQPIETYRRKTFVLGTVSPPSLVFHGGLGP